jgi:FlaA1/EpsC-like NDP-sugar epimerase
LNWEEIQINQTEIISRLKDKVILITGAVGSIGSELCRQLCRLGVKQLILIDNAETPLHTICLELEEKFPDVQFRSIIGDVRVKERMETLFTRFYPQIVFHTAAYKHVPLMEENPCEAVLVNVYGTMNMVDLAVKYEVEQFVMISPDKAVNPTNVMGPTKRMAEIYVQSLGLSIDQGKKEEVTHFTTTRFGNVLGSNGSVIPRFWEQLQKGGPLTVTHPGIIRYFMTIPEQLSIRSRLHWRRKRNFHIRYGRTGQNTDLCDA